MLKVNPDKLAAESPSRLCLKAMNLCVALLLPALAAGCAVHGHLYHHHSSSSYHTTVTSTGGLNLPEEDRMQLRYTVRDGCAALESERAVLVFDGLTPAQRELFHFQGDQQAVQIAGNGLSSVSVTCVINQDQVSFSSHYAGGTNTLEFAGQSVRLVDGGRLLLAGDQRVDLSAGRKIVHLRHGKAVIE
jgi:hypothetical protein